jgi:hypothetical protein
VFASERLHWFSLVQRPKHGELIDQRNSNRRFLLFLPEVKSDILSWPIKDAVVFTKLCTITSSSSRRS